MCGVLCRHRHTCNHFRAQFSLPTRSQNKTRNFNGQQYRHRNGTSLLDWPSGLLRDFDLLSQVILATLWLWNTKSIHTQEQEAVMHLHHAMLNCACEMPLAWMPTA